MEGEVLPGVRLKWAGSTSSAGVQEEDDWVSQRLDRLQPWQEAGIEQGKAEDILSPYGKEERLTPVPRGLRCDSHSITGCKEDDEHVPGDILDLDYAVAERRRRIWNWCSSFSLEYSQPWAVLDMTKDAVRWYVLSVPVCIRSLFFAKLQKRQFIGFDIPAATVPLLSI